jgi:hypothetical protein
MNALVKYILGMIALGFLTATLVKSCVGSFEHAKAVAVIATQSDGDE